MNDNNTSLIPIGSTDLVRVGNTIAITNKIIKEYQERRDSENFKSVKIGNQYWMTKNLDVDCYLNGDPIPQVQNQDEWENTKSGAWCYINNDPRNGNRYGKLYNWFAIYDERGLSPKGYKIPKEDDWIILFQNLKEIKEINLKVLTDYNPNGINEKLLNFMPGGYRHKSFIGPGGNTTFFGSKTEVDDNNGLLLLSFAGSFRLESAPKFTGSYVRCLKI